MSIMKLLYNTLIGLLYVTAVAYLLLAPFTKVEESFNVQATHDIQVHGIFNIDKFDHLEFPGVVPRTFIGPLLLSISAIPGRLWSSADGSSFHLLVLMRMELALITVSSFVYLLMVYRREFSETDAIFSALSFLSQFHLLFYASRPLPNVFALILTTAANAIRIGNPQSPWSTALLCLAAAIFRCELSILILTTWITDSIVFRNTLWKRFGYGALGGVFGAVFSIAIDSYFWKRILYPELEVFYFNVFLNKSKEWGVSAFHWYFTNAIPRALLGALPLAIYGLVRERRLLRIAVPNILFVVIYSYLPHKELRFIFYVLPILNLCAGAGLSSLWKSRSKSILRMLMFLVGLGLLLSSAVLSSFFMYVSSQNYPGGAALRQLHAMESTAQRSPVLGQAPAHRSAHLDVETAMTGASRYLEVPVSWTYSKREDVENVTWTDFSHLVTSRSNVDGFQVIHTQKGYAGLDLKKPGVRLADKIFVHVRTDLSDKKT